MYDPNKNSLPEIALTSVALGSVFGACLWSLVWQAPRRYFNLYVYLICLCVYHMMEFIQTARFQPSKVTAKSFLLWGARGNKEFLLVQLMNLWEYFFVRSKYNTIVRHRNCQPYSFVIGLAICVFGQYLRSRAMEVCGESFSHFIETSPSAQTRSKLITHGPYAYTRHPSYLGFWCFVVGIETMLENWGCLVVSMAILTWFFKRRIEFEEWFLVNRLYGEEYLEYRGKVGVWIPFVLVKDIEYHRERR